MAAVTLLKTEGLSRQFGGVRAVDDVSFTLPEGEIRAVIGPNGAGKTTLVGLICGRVRADSGRILFAGADITGLAAHRRVRQGIAYTFQITSIFGNLTVFDNVALAVQNGMRPGGGGGRFDAGDLAARVEAVLDKVGLADRMHMRASELAYGHQRLVEIAMGLGLAPRLLILDEPTQGLSDGEIANFCALVADTIAARATVLLIEHNMAVVMELAQRITVMERGRVLAEGSPGDIRSDAAVQRAYLGA